MKKLLSAFCAFVFTIVMTAVIPAATFTVTKAADTDDGTCDADCSLREAIAEANSSATSDEINFDSSIFSSPQTITLTNGQINIAVSESITINGPGANLLTISGNNQSRIFFSNFSSISIIINDLTLSQGFETNGGAILSSAALILSNVIITDNTAMGIEVGPGQFRAGLGGGIYSTGSLRLTNSTISNNLASGDIVPNPTNGDFGTAGGGGGIFSYGFFTTIINCTFADNTAKGMSSPTGTDNPGGSAYGGAIYSIFHLNIVSSDFENNSAAAGNGGTIVSSGETGRGGEAFGGAIYSSGSKFLNSTFSNNSAIGGNGGSVTGNGGPSFGGGIRDDDLEMANTTVVNNTVISGNGVNGGNGFGGGIYGGSNQWSIVNSTITGNSVTGGAGTQVNGLIQGGGVFSNTNAGPASSFRNNIVAENTAASGTDVFGNFINATFNLVGIGEGSTGITNGVNGNLVGTTNAPIDPGLAALADNGGFNQTRALLEGSPAIDAGNNMQAMNPFTSQVLQFDQRGLQRISPTGGLVDMGAYEYDASVVPNTATPDLRDASDSGISNTDNITMESTAVFDVSDVIPGALVELLRDGIVISSTTATMTTGTISLTDTSPPFDGVVLYTSRQSIPGTTSAVSSALTVTFDNTSPTVTINQASQQLDPTGALPINFTVIYNEPISFFPSSSVSLADSTANVSSAIITINSTSSTNFNVAVRNVVSNGLTVSAAVSASAVRDLAGNFNLASTSSDNIVTLDNVAPTVTIDQAIGQEDPASTQPIDFTAFFSESVTGFNAADISLVGSTANVTFANITVTGAGNAYAVSISNITSSGLIKASVTAGAAIDAVGNLSASSTSSDNTVTVNIPGRSKIFDFDGDSKTDVSVFRPGPGEWWYLRSIDGGNTAFQFGQTSDTIIPADYTGDGRTDVAFWRSGEWFVLRSEDNSFFSFPFGTNGDIPAPGDFDGDGKADPTVFRPASATWFTLRSSDGGTTITPFGAAEDKPVIADYDGDGKDDIAVFRPSVSEWWINRSQDGLTAFQFGATGDKAVPADYTGDGRADVAFFRPSSGFWFVLRSEDSSFFAFPFGATGDLPVPGDYDGDGTADPAVFRPSNNTWFKSQSTNGFEAVAFGVNGDVPVPNVYVVP